MKKLLVYIYEGMADFEISLLCHLLVADCGKDVLIISDNLDEVRSKSGMKFLPDEILANVNLDEVEGLIIPGGWLASLSHKLIEIIKTLNDDRKLIAAICAAPWILAKAGILEGVKYTTSISTWGEAHREFFKMEDPFPRESYVECKCYRDENIITAKGTAFIDFSVEVCEYLRLFESEGEKLELLNQLRCS